MLESFRNTRGLIITGGKGPDSGVTIKNRRQWCVIAADSGLDTALSIGIEPDFIVGDMDSISDSARLNDFDEQRIIRYSKNKDWTDTEIAMDVLNEKGVSDITIMGGGGGRLDHLMGILALFERLTHPLQWITHRDVITVIDGDVRFDAPSDGVVSFFPVGNKKCTMESYGLKWPLNKLQWNRGDVGISNECTELVCRVRVLTGRLLMVHRLDRPLRL